MFLNKLCLLFKFHLAPRYLTFLTHLAMEYLRADAGDLALAAVETFSDKKVVWVVDKESGFAKATILQDMGDTLRITKVGNHEVMLFLQIVLP